VTTAQLVVSVAGHRVDVARREIDHFAATAYMSGGLSAMTAIVNADGPQVLLDRVGTLDAIARSQRDATQSLEAARVYQVTVEHEAAAALARARSSAAAAASARHTAEAAVSRQSGMLQSLRSRRHELAALLTHARQHASALERARLAAIARARAAAARRAAARAAAARARAVAATPVVVGGSSGVTGNVTGTVSAATEQRALSYAEAQIGKPYQWGAAGPDTYDCSGLVMWAYAQVGVTLDHWTGFQWQEGAHISTAQLRAGDLLFFATDTSNPDTIHHVGMYVGNGQMVEAPYTGANVRISSAWRSDLIGAVRPYDR
jgi:cell wall-associated NlpC family hydrolase